MHRYVSRLVTRGNRGTLTGIAVMAGFLHYYYYLLLRPTLPDRPLIERYQKIAAGSDWAPDQYRLLIPKAAAVVTGATSLPLDLVVLTIDSVSLIGGGLVLAHLLRQRGLEAQISPVLLYITACASTVLLYPRPETLPAFLGASCVLMVYMDPGRATSVLGAVGALLLAGCRPETAAAAAIPFALRWWEDRRAVDVAASAALVSLGAAGALIPLLLYPNVRYMTDVVQIRYNLNPENELVVLFIFAPLLAYLTRTALRRWAPLLAWVGLEFAFTLVVGRVDEVRIFFPLSGMLGFVAAHLWAESRTVHDPMGPSMRPGRQECDKHRSSARDVEHIPTSLL